VISGNAQCDHVGKKNRSRVELYDNSTTKDDFMLVQYLSCSFLLDICSFVVGKRCSRAPASLKEYVSGSLLKKSISLDHTEY
jgi:hypothetical protein